MLNTLGEIKTNGWTNLAMRQQKLKNDFQGILSCILSLITKDHYNCVAVAIPSPLL